MWLEDLQVAIVEQGFEGLAHENVVIGAPEDGEGVPHFLLGLVDRPGPVDVTYGSTAMRPNLTVVLRSNPMKAGPAYDVLDEVFIWLTSQANVTFGESSFLWFEPMLSPGKLRVDNKFRTDLTCEIGVWRAPVVTS